MILYNLKTEGQDFRITKFDDDFNPSSSYLVNESACECPQGHKPTCRHRKMLPVMEGRADSPWFYCYDDGTWHTIGGEEPEIEMFAPVPEGVQVVSLEDPQVLHETIAKAVGEAPFRRRI